MYANVSEIKISDFDYSLADEQIAKHPIEERDQCKLLVRNAAGEISHHIFSELPQMLPEGSMLICNNTRVINARMHFRKHTGATIEIFCLEPILPVDYAQMFQTTVSCRWACMVGNLKRWKTDKLSKVISMPENGAIVNLTAERIAPHGNNAWEIEFCWDNPGITFASIIEAAGYIPIPPYLNRESEDTDKIDYQTVYSKIKGSVAAPTAGLHFTDKVIDDIANRDIRVRELTLHVGAGTFQPVKSDTIGMHPMHTEVFSISAQLLNELIAQLEVAGRIVAVGTTSVRTLESLPYLGKLISDNDSIKVEELHVDQWSPYTTDDFDTISALKHLAHYMSKHDIQFLTASTSIMIAPGFKWRMVNDIVTNFHQPQSTLLLLVSSFIDNELTAEPQWRKMYDEALNRGYRFLSYGDSSFLSRP